MISTGGTTTLGLYDFKSALDDFGRVDYWKVKPSGYQLYERAILTNGAEVQSTIDGNTNNPNIDMAGWVGVSNKTAFVSNYGAKKGISQVSDTAFSRAVNELNAGDTLVVDGDYYLANDWIINKEINLDVRGEIYLNGNNNNAIKFNQEASYTLAGYSLIGLPAVGDSILLLPPPTGENLADYCFTLESTEILTNRLGFTEPYYKNEFGYFLSADGLIASSINIDYLDAEKLTIKLYKKQRGRTVSNLVPKIKSGTFTGSSRMALVRETGVNNTTYNNCGVNKTNAESLGEGWAINRSGMNTYNNPIAIKTDKSGGDAYPFVGFIHGHNTFNGPKIILANNTHQGRFFASRHGSEIVFNELSGSLDEHWGYKYTINDSTIYSGKPITFAGGALKLKNVNRSARDSSEALVTLRSDTPTATGDLIFENCNINGPVFYANRSFNEATKGVLRKSFDRVIINDSTIDDYGYQSLSFRGYDSVSFINDTRKKTELIIQNTTYRRHANVGTQYGLINNQIQSGWNVFSKVTLNNVTPEIIGTDSTADLYYLIRYMQTDVLDVINCHELSMQSPVIGVGKILGGSIGNIKGGLDSLDISGKLDFIGTTFNESMFGMSVKAGVLDKIGYLGCTFNSDKMLTPTLLPSVANMSGNTYGASISPTLYSQTLDITNHTNQNRRKQLFNSTSLSTALTLPANTKSSAKTVSTVGARLGDFVKVSVTHSADLTSNAWVSSDNAVTYTITNNTSSSITIPIGTLVNVKVSKI